jgi:hypothetical protein
VTPALSVLGLAGALAASVLSAPAAVAADGQPDSVTFTITGGGQQLDTAGEVLVRPYVREGDEFVPTTVYHGGAGYPMTIDLPDGDYKISVQADGDFWRPGFYGGDALADAEVVSVQDDPVVLEPLDLDPLSGVLVGRVVDDEGAAVPGAVVQVFEDGWGFEQSAPTDSGGVYRIRTVSPSMYRLQILPPAESGLAMEWYDDVATAAEADLVAASAGARVSEVELSPGGSVAGRVTGADGSPLPDVVVGALAADGTALGWADTDPAGGYRLDGLKAGTVRVVFQDNFDGYVREFYANADTLDTATPVTITDGGVTTGIDASLAVAPEEEAEGSAVRGRALDSAGRGIRDVSVSAWVPDGNEWEAIDWARTDRFGRYLLDDIESAGPDDEHAVVRIEFEEGGGPGPLSYRGIYYGQQPTVRRAPDVVVPEGQVVTGVDDVLQQYGGLRGTVTTPYVGADVAVSVVDVDGRTVAQPWVDEQGSWEASTLAPGDYRVLVEGMGYDTETGEPVLLAPRWWVDGNNFATAAPVTVAEGAYTATGTVPLTDQLLAYALPLVSGTPVVGRVLAASPGRWNVNAGVEHSYEWLRGATVVGTGATYAPTAADVGSPLQVRVIARLWDWTGVATSAPTAPVTTPAAPPTGVVQASSRTTVKTTYDRKKRVLTLRITVASAAAPTGTVVVAEARRTVKALALKGGRASLTVKRPTPGKHAYTVSYAGSTTVQASTATASVKVPQPRR